MISMPEISLAVESHTRSYLVFHYCNTTLMHILNGCVTGSFLVYHFLLFFLQSRTVCTSTYIVVAMFILHSTILGAVSWFCMKLCIIWDWCFVRSQRRSLLLIMAGRSLSLVWFCVELSLRNYIAKSSFFKGV